MQKSILNFFYSLYNTQFWKAAFTMSYIQMYLLVTLLNRCSDVLCSSVTENEAQVFHTLKFGSGAEKRGFPSLDRLNFIVSRPLVSPAHSHAQHVTY